MKDKTLLICADAAVDTGFGNVTFNLVNYLKDHWNIHILAVNYRGDPHPIQRMANIFSPTALDSNDVHGFGRLPDLVKNINPDVFLTINDPWVAAEHAGLFDKYPATLKKVVYTPVDSPNLKKRFVEPLNKYDHVIAYTEFGKQELKRAGLNTTITVIPHGVDTTNFYPVSKEEARRKANIDQDWFIVQVCNRNSLRKRLDLALYYFAEFARDKPNAYFYYHGALWDTGTDLTQLADYLGIRDRLIVTSVDMRPGIGLSIDQMRYVYSLADIQLSTTLGEGFGMTTHEAMACGIPCLVPDWSALGEWPRGGVEYIDIADEPFFHTNNLNTMGGVPSMKSAIEKLNKLYYDKEYRLALGKKGYELATQDKFDWHTIGKQFHKQFVRLLETNEDY